MSPHTPEPWTLIEDHGSHIMGGGHFIGDRYVGGHCIARLIDSTEATPANARLMIAAPGLLKALEEALPVLTVLKGTEYASQMVKDRYERARAAIRKARGR